MEVLYKMQRQYKARAYRKKYPVAKRSEASVRAIVKKEIEKDAEKKYCTITDATADAIDYTTGVVDNLALLLDGTGASGRVGTKIQPRGLNYRYKIVNTTANNVIRFCIIQWFEATTPTVADIFQTSSAISTASAPLMATNIENKKLFKVLHDELIHVKLDITGLPVPVAGKVYIPGNRLRPITYVGSGVSTVKNAGLYAVFVSDVIAGGTAPSRTYVSQLAFIDF